MDRLVHQKEMTEKGKDWVIQTLDPFHDTQRDKSGFPDVTNGNSFIQQVTLSESFPVVEETDFHIFSMPQATVRVLEQYPMTTPTVADTNFGSLPSFGPVGPLNVITARPGAKTMPSYNSETGYWIPADTRGAAFAFDLEPYLVGDSRVVSLGFEVINTGPELLKSGAIVTYRAPQTNTPSTLILADSPDVFRPITRSSLPPATNSEALLLYGSQQWEAYDGAYLVNTMFEVSNPIGIGDYSDQFYTNSNSSGADPNGHVGYYMGPRKAQLFPEVANTSRPIPFNTAGAYVTGAALGTTLTVVLKAYIECFPTPDLKSYVTLTEPSVPYDPMALELYSRAAFHLKPGVKQDANPAGEYWRMVKGVLNEVAPTIGNAVHTVEAAGRQVAKPIKSVIDQTKTFGDDQTRRRSTAKRGRARRGRA